MFVRPDLVLMHAPSVYDFRRKTILYGPIADVIPSLPVYEMYPVGFTTIAEYLLSLGFETRVVNLAYRMLASDRFDAERIGDALQHIDGRRIVAAFETTDIGAVHIRPIGKLFLRQLCRKPEPLQIRRQCLS